MNEVIQVIDSHTGGEPTRLVIAGGPDFSQYSQGFPGATPTEACRALVRDLAENHDHWRTGLLLEPRGGDHWVGAWLLPARDPSHLCGVIFFNNAGYLGMCGHGTIGLMASLAYLGRIQPGIYGIETPVGVVQAELLDQHQVRIGNVPSYRYRHGVAVQVQGREVVGDIAWGGNWFFLTEQHGIDVQLDNLESLMETSQAIQAALQAQSITGRDGAYIDHIELFGAGSEGADSRNFVLCPGGAYDRSPCGTGTSAKVACLAAAGKLNPGEVWVQESITGSRFAASYQWCDFADSSTDGASDKAVQPNVTGSAYVCGAGSLVFASEDPFRHGISA